MKKDTLINILPLGSIITLKKGTKKIMVIGRCQQDIKNNIRYDYTACLYPEGVIDPRELYLFNQEDIDIIYFIGLQDTEEFAFRKFMRERLEELHLLED